MRAKQTIQKKLEEVEKEQKKAFDDWTGETDPIFKAPSHRHYVRTRAKAMALRWVLGREKDL